MCRWSRADFVSAVARWSDADDQVLQHGTEAELQDLVRTYGRQGVFNRQEFLAAFASAKKNDWDVIRSSETDAVF